MPNLSSLHRSSTLKSLQEREFDLVVIGGGVTGAGIALDAASRGLSVALVEKNDFASGTSSRSTKLVHGGLRYLKQLDIALVREVGTERAIVHQLAPHLVIPEKMLLPLVEGGTYGKLGTSFGLMVYDFLAKVEGDDKRVMLSKEETLAKEPILKDDIVKGSGFYAEYRTDDARLTIELIKTAAEYGAISINYVQAADLIYEDNQVKGIVARDERSAQEFNIRSKFTVSATGPWVDDIRKINNSLAGKHLFLSKGVHIVVPHERLPVNNAVYFDVPDGRMIFAIPRQRVTYIGPTDTPYQGDINHVVTKLEDVEYILDGTNSMFPGVKLTVDDVESSWAGLRPLIHEAGKSASELSRKDEIFESETGLISIAGGKLTGYRKMAERIVDLVTKKYERQYDQQFKDCYTDEIPLSGGPFENSEEVRSYKKTVLSKTDKLGLPPYIADYLVANYGRQSDTIFILIEHFPDEPAIALARAEFKFCSEHELAISPMDFYARRTGRLYFDINSIEPTLEAILGDARSYFSWDDLQVAAERKKVQQAVYEASHFEFSPEKIPTK